MQINDVARRISKPPKSSKRRGRHLAQLVLAALSLATFLTAVTATTASAQTPTCDGEAVTINMNTNGGVGFGTGGNDVILGTPNDDTINGLGGNDIICAGEGNDTVFGGGGDDRIFGHSGDDTIMGATGRDYVQGGIGNDTIVGQGGLDTLFGQGDNDTIKGMGANDFIYGGHGNDRLFGNGGVDRIWGGADLDQIWGGTLGDFLYGEGTRDIIRGGGGADTIDGGWGNDDLYGDANTDILTGGDGTDRFDGGLAQDTCVDVGPGEVAISCELPPQGCQDDDLEPNDDLGSATMLTSGANIQGRICAVNTDWFSFEANAGDEIAISATFEHANGDIDIGLVFDDAQIDGSTSTSNNESIQTTAAASGIYYVEVYGYQAEEDEGEFDNSYELTIDVVESDSYDFGGGLVIRTGPNSTKTSGPDGTLTLGGLLLMESAIGDIPLPGSDLTIKANDSGLWEIVSGSFGLTLPSTGIFADLNAGTISSSVVEIKKGSELAHTGVPLGPEHLYFVLQMGANAIDIQTNFDDGTPDKVALPSGIGFNGGGDTFLIVNPRDPFVYFGSSLCDFSFSVTISEPDPDDAPDQCGVGFSYNSFIPEGTVFSSGNVLLKGVFPIYKGVTMTGQVIMNATDDLFWIVGTGEFDLGLKFFKSAPIDLEIPVGEGRVTLLARNGADGSGQLAFSINAQSGMPEEYTLPLIGMPIKLPASPTNTVNASVDVSWDAAGEVTLNPSESYVEIGRDGGSMAINPGPFAVLSALNLGESLGEASQTGKLRIGEEGVRVTATQTASLHSKVQTSGSVTVDAFVSFTDIADSYLQLDGQFDVLGYPMGEAYARLDKTGLKVSGKLDAGGVVTIEITGAISANPFLTGSATVNLDTSEALREASDALGDARDELESTRIAVQQGLEDASQAFQDAEAAVRSAQNAFNSIAAEANENIRINNNKIRNLQSQIDNCSGFECLAVPVWLGEIGVLETANVTQQGFIDAARGTLTLAEDALAGIRTEIIEQVSLDPLVNAAQATLSAAQTTVNQMNSILPTMSISGNINATLNNSGLSASFSGTGCVAGSCQSIGGSVVIFSNRLEVCVLVPGIDEEVCVTID